MKGHKRSEKTIASTDAASCLGEISSALLMLGESLSGIASVWYEPGCDEWETLTQMGAELSRLRTRISCVKESLCTRCKTLQVTETISS